MSKNKSKDYDVIISYSVSKYGWGSLDKDAKSIAKVGIAAGGTGFGRRDLIFAYETKRRAANAADRFRSDKRFKVERVADVAE